MEGAGAPPSPQGNSSSEGFRQVPSNSNSDVESGAVAVQKACSSRSRWLVAFALACAALVLTFAAHRSGVLRGASVASEAVGLSDGDHEVLQVHAFGPYRFNYDGPLKIEGSMKVKSTGDGDGASQILDYDLKGIDPECGTKDITGIANACGIHIHIGISCAEDAGGHYFAVDSDPWKSVTYAAVDGGAARAEGVAVVTGLSGHQIFNHVVIVHDSTGAKAGCGSLMEFMEGEETSDFDCDAGINNAEAGWSGAKKKWCCAEKKVGCELSGGESTDFLVPSFVPYHNYEGDLKVAGAIRVASTDAAQTLAWRLSGTDPECGSKDITGVAGACGVHIHVGTDCADSAGGHYFKGDDDPWGVVHYATADGASQNSDLTITSGRSSSEVLGHTMIVHDSSGAKIACGILKAAVAVPSFSAYVNYAGSLKVTGTVVIATTGEGDGAAQVVEWQLKGTDPACRNKDLGDVPNACGVHIHVGTSCSEDAGGHYFTGDKDPWASVHYITAEDGSSSMGEKVVTGLDAGKITGHAFIVHDSTGAKVACGIIGA